MQKFREGETVWFLPGQMVSKDTIPLQGIVIACWRIDRSENHYDIKTPSGKTHHRAESLISRSRPQYEQFTDAFGTSSKWVVPKVLSQRESDWLGLPHFDPINVPKEILEIEGKWSKLELQSLAMKHNLDPRGDKRHLVYMLQYHNILDEEGNLVSEKAAKKSGTDKKLQLIEMVNKTVKNIEELVELELKRHSQARKKQLEKLYESLSLYVRKLGVTTLILGTYYSPDEYLKKARSMQESVNSKYRTILVAAPQTKGKDISYYVEQNKRILRENRDKFKRVFGVPLEKYMNIITGFDIVAFDTWLGVPEGVSMWDHIIKKYGKETADWFKKELI